MFISLCLSLLHLPSYFLSYARLRQLSSSYSSLLLLVYKKNTFLIWAETWHRPYSGASRVYVGVLALVTQTWGRSRRISLECQHSAAPADTSNTWRPFSVNLSVMKLDMAVGIRHADHVASSNPQKLEQTSPTSGGRSVGIIRSRTQATEFTFSLYIYIYICTHEMLSWYPNSTLHCMLPMQPSQW
jgi:hypothetical protein